MKTSSKKRHQTQGLSSQESKKRSSKYPINKFAKPGANLVPRAVPNFCRNIFSSNSKKLFSKTKLANTNINSYVPRGLNLREGA